MGLGLSKPGPESKTMLEVKMWLGFGVAWLSYGTLTKRPTSEANQTRKLWSPAPKGVEPIPKKVEPDPKIVEFNPTCVETSPENAEPRRRSVEPNPQVFSPAS